MPEFCTVFRLNSWGQPDSPGLFIVHRAVPLRILVAPNPHVRHVKLYAQLPADDSSIRQLENSLCFSEVPSLGYDLDGYTQVCACA